MILEVRGLPIIIAASISVAMLLLCVLTIILCLKRRSTLPSVEAPAHKMEKIPSNTSIAALESRFYPSMRINGLVLLPLFVFLVKIHPY